MRFILVEDNFQQARLIEDAIRRSFAHAVVEVVQTESRFYARIPEFVERPPNAIVLDMMLRWRDANETVDPPPEVVSDVSTAGIRCARRLNAIGHVPIVLYTVLERTDFDDGLAQVPGVVAYVSKQADFTELMSVLKRFTDRD
jgi:CheY-like chemotaxis protein